MLGDRGEGAGLSTSSARGRDRIYARDGFRDVIGCGSGRDRVVADHKDLVARSCEIVRYG